LVDGIYPEWSIFVNTYTNPIEAKKKVFAKETGMRNLLAWLPERE
jgi:Plant transposon protein